MFDYNQHQAEQIEHEVLADHSDEHRHGVLSKFATKPGYQFPPRIWGLMLASYAVFFVAILAATGGSGHARFAIVISILYTVMFFGLARIGAGIGGREDASPLDRGHSLQTWTGPMDSKSAHAQVLVVPVVIALFGIGIAAIIAIIF